MQSGVLMYAMIMIESLIISSEKVYKNREKSDREIGQSGKF